MIEEYCYGFTIDYCDFETSETEYIHDILFKIKGVYEVDGPHIHGSVGVLMYASEYDSIEDAKKAISKIIKK